MIWYNENNIEMKTDSVTAKDRHVINSSPLVDQIWEYLECIWANYPRIIY